MAKLQPASIGQRARQDASAILSVIQLPTVPCPPKTRSAFLELPLELRLQIYSYVLSLNPARHANLSPSAAAPLLGHSPHFLHSLASRLSYSLPRFEGSEPSPTESRSSWAESSSSQSSASFLRGTGCGKMPSALLQTCRQVYSEARMIPWEENEFVFINWFSSGVFAARAFLRGLAPWQRETLHWARIEVLARDLRSVPLSGGHPNEGDWSELCNLLKGNGSQGRRGGLWGLRLSVHGQIISQAIPYTVDARSDLGILHVNAQWVETLKGLAALKYLEIEFGDSEIAKECKKEFCIDLGLKLSTPGHRVVVISADGLAETNGRVAEGTDFMEPEEDPS